MLEINDVVLYRIVLCCIVLYCIVLYCIVLYCITFHYVSFHFIALHCIALYIALHCIVLYCKYYTLDSINQIHHSVSGSRKRSAKKRQEQLVSVCCRIMEMTKAIYHNTINISN